MKSKYFFKDEKTLISWFGRMDRYLVDNRSSAGLIGLNKKIGPTIDWQSFFFLNSELF